MDTRILNWSSKLLLLLTIAVANLALFFATENIGAPVIVTVSILVFADYLAWVSKWPDK